MNIKKALTPKDTEEIKPNLFIQKKGDNYRHITPLVWNDKWNLKNQFSWKNLIWIVIVLFLAWSYLNDVGAYKQFYEEVTTNPIEFCSNADLTSIENEEGVFNLPNNIGYVE